MQTIVNQLPQKDFTVFQHQQLKMPEPSKNVPKYRWASVNTKNNSTTTESQKLKQLDICDWDYYKTTKNDHPNFNEELAKVYQQPKNAGNNNPNTRNYKTSLNLPKKTLETPKIVTTQTEINTNVSSKSDSIIALRNKSECIKHTQVKNQDAEVKCNKDTEVKHKDNEVIRKKMLKAKKTPKIVPKREESNRFSCLPVYTATPVSFEDTSTQTKPKKPTLPKKPPKAILIGLPEVFHETLPEELASLGYDGVIVSKIKTRYPDYPPALVQLPIGYDIGQFKKINRLSNCAVEIQIYTGVQCFNCKSSGHALKNCKRPPRCDKCGLEHFICECHKGESGGYCSIM